jgi:hypothetical protein
MYLLVGRIVFAPEPPEVSHEVPFPGMTVWPNLPKSVCRSDQGGEGSRDISYDAGVGEVWMHADDTGYGSRADVQIEARDNILPTTCKMKRP